ncbi:FG-GAP repeat domain-containing protein [Winogradskyella helgolandensis]|uniref:FG-GAP repeat domain-containing protein n=1 Tax=Winogradskyella helgolandensis TaxID=2697010 RepID=UPI0015B85897|nr:VCBS repeat-containing protein [Winogradskyella helgolandensis]
MKKITLLLIAILTLSACSSDDNSENENPTDGGTNGGNTNSDFSISSICMLNDWTIDSKPIDYDNDGDIDIITYEEIDGFYLYENIDNNTYVKSILLEYQFANLTTYSNIIAQFDVGDLDNDGDIDIIFTKHQRLYDSSTIGWFENIGTEFLAYSNIKSYSNNQGISYDVISYDFDNDGDLDFVNNNMDIFVNDGNANFDIINISDNWSSHFMEITDFDDDGNMDILVISGASANFGTSGSTTLYINNGSNSFDRNVFDVQNTIGNNYLTGSLGDLTDINNDGYKDLIVGYSSRPSQDASLNNLVPNIYILLSNTESILTGNYEEIRIELPYIHSSSLATTDIVSLDIDNDSDKDLIFHFSGAFSVSYNENNGTQWENHDIIPLEFASPYERVTNLKIGNYDNDSGEEIFVSTTGNAAYIISSNFCR